MRLSRLVSLVLLTLSLLFSLLPLAPSALAADTIQSREWWLSTMHVSDAWSITRGAGVTVAVVDSGIDSSNPDLTNQVTSGVDYTSHATYPGGPIENDATASHGTAMASLIAGHGHSHGHYGVMGVAPEAKILSLGVGINGSSSSADPTASTDQIISALHYAVDHGAKVVNLSLSCCSARLLPAIAYAQSHGALLVAAAGNEGTNDLSLPCTAFGVVCVSGVDADLSLDPESSFGGFTTSTSTTSAPTVSAGGVSLAAPYATSPSEGLPVDCIGSYSCTAKGTSAATAIVSGIAALLFSAHPTWSSADVVTHLLHSAYLPPSTPFSLGPATADRLGYGIPNALTALTLSLPPTSENPLGTEVSSSPGIWASSLPRPTSSPSPTPLPSTPHPALRPRIYYVGAALGVLLLVSALTLVLALRHRPDHAPRPNHAPLPGYQPLASLHPSHYPPPSSPAQYPPAQYPPAQYPPAQTPPAQYPPPQYSAPHSPISPPSTPPGLTQPGPFYPPQHHPDFFPPSPEHRPIPGTLPEP